MSFFFFFFHNGFFIITMLVEEQLDLLIKKENNKITIAMYRALVDIWETPAHMHHPPLAKNCPSIVLLESSPHPLSNGAECVGDNGAVCYRWIFFSFLTPPMKITAWPSLLLIVKLQSLFFWFLIFFSLAFLENALLVFNFILEFKFMVLFFPIWSLLSWFIIFFLDLFGKSLLVFNFIFQFKFMALFFLIWYSLFWFLIFFYWLFCKKFICFKFHYSIKIYSILLLPIWSSFFFFPCV